MAERTRRVRVAEGARWPKWPEVPKWRGAEMASGTEMAGIRKRHQPASKDWIRFENERARAIKTKTKNIREWAAVDEEYESCWYSSRDIEGQRHNGWYQAERGMSWACTPSIYNQRKLIFRGRRGGR